MCDTNKPDRAPNQDTNSPTQHRLSSHSINLRVIKFKHYLILFFFFCGMSFIAYQVAEELAFHREGLVEELYTVLSHSRCQWPHTFPVYVWVSYKKSINIFAKHSALPLLWVSLFHLSFMPPPSSKFLQSICEHLEVIRPEGECWPGREKMTSARNPGCPF